jgi:hypothetical protein
MVSRGQLRNRRELEQSSPSRRDGISVDDERRLRRELAKFIHVLLTPSITNRLLLSRWG